MGISERVKELRKEHLHLSQSAFGERVGVSRDVINNIERDRLAKPEQKTALLKLICKEFNVNEEWLLNGHGTMLAEDDKPQLLEFAKQQGATDLEMRIIKACFSLQPDIRNKIMDFLTTQVLNSTNSQNDISIQSTTIPQKSFEETVDVKTKIQIAEEEYIKNISSSATKTTSSVLNFTTDTQNLKENLGNKVSNQ